MIHVQTPSRGIRGSTSANLSWGAADTPLFARGVGNAIGHTFPRYSTIKRSSGAFRAFSLFRGLPPHTFDRGPHFALAIANHCGRLSRGGLTRYDTLKHDLAMTRRPRASMVRSLGAERFPGFLIGDFNGDGSGGFGGGEDGEEVEGFGAGVVGAVDNGGGEVDGVAGFHDAFFAFDPLFGGPGKDVEDFFHVWMVMEAMGFAGRELGADEHEVGVGDHARFAVPEMGFAGEAFDFGIGEGDDAPWGRVCVAHGKRSAAGRGEFKS